MIFLSSTKINWKERLLCVLGLGLRFVVAEKAKKFPFSFLIRSVPSDTWSQLSWKSEFSIIFFNWIIDKKSKHKRELERVALNRGENESCKLDDYLSQNTCWMWYSRVRISRRHFTHHWVFLGGKIVSPRWWQL